MAVYDHEVSQYTRVIFYVQSSISLLLCFSLFLFISLRQSLRRSRCNQGFLNILLVHILFNISTIAAETNAPGMFLLLLLSVTPSHQHCVDTLENFSNTAQNKTYPHQHPQKMTKDRGVFCTLENLKSFFKHSVTFTNTLPTPQRFP